jgi:lysylphosphatidylglycerol synthetase-like protein (DUF2156 family)
LANVDQGLHTTVIFLTRYSPTDIAQMGLPQKLLVYVYIATANVVVQFFPIFWNIGQLVTPLIFAILIGAALTLTGAAIVVRYTQNHLRALPARLPKVTGSVYWVGLVIGGWVLPGLARWLPSQSVTDWLYRVQVPGVAGILPLYTGWVYLLQGILSILIIWACVFYRQWPVQHRVLAVFALAFVGLSSALVFNNFSLWTHYLGVPGWLLVWLISQRHLTSGLWQNTLRRLMLGFMIALVGLSALATYSALPNPLMDPKVSPYLPELCDTKYPSELIREISIQYHLDLPCRSGS